MIRRYVFILLFVAVLLTPFVMRRLLLRGAAAQTVADKDALRLVIVTPQNQDIRREFARAFSAWHLRHYGRAADLDFRVPGATNDIKRLLDTTYRSFRDASGRLSDDFVPDIQIVWGGGDFVFNELKNFPHGSVLQPTGLTQEQLDEIYPRKTLAGVSLYDQATDAAGRPLPPQWVGVCLSAFGIVYNPSLYWQMGLPAPTRWHDLTRPELAGSLALADPSHSGSAATAYMMVVQRAMADAEGQFRRDHPDVPKSAWAKNAEYKAAIARGWKRGMGDLLLIAANARYWTPWSSQVPADVAHGDAAAGVAIDFYALVTEGIVGADRARFVSPADATAVTPDPVAILAGVKGEKLTLARHFVEFLLTREAQLLWVLKPGTPGGPRERLLGRPPVRRDVYPPGPRPPDWSDTPNPFEQSHTFNQRPEWMGLFAETRLIWSAAWVDSREALRSAYGAVLDVPDPQKRTALPAQLADLPLEMADLEQMRAARKQIESQKGDVEGWRARTRIEWAERFREHYRTVAKRAAR